ncbi:Hypothetical predicted protein [Xyrichtys novacula]|uniref:Uncharacterized protein n=1 Tax=Xyrichtys novacula TaxID=13765 RepID=A0AAV1GUA7_XYRNO|nr:Hypothetical predicted protein [Xyrichtys novacula]
MPPQLRAKYLEEKSFNRLKSERKDHEPEEALEVSGDVFYLQAAGEEHAVCRKNTTGEISYPAETERG